ncbi:MAG: alpha/beta fold hydrolase [Spirochaetales bacterium]|nr:alpha/beta fold hydrolase [Spirochaetales bacterium]
MSLFVVLCLILCLLLLLGHFGLPEPYLPGPPAPDPDRIMAEAAPYRFEGHSGVCFILCHGFRGSAHNTRSLGEFIHQMGHTAIGVLLPGHGTTIEEMTKVRYYHWYDHLEKVFLEERSRYRKVVLVGFSLGGMLTLDVAARNADSFRPAALITISAPVFLNGFYNGRLVLAHPTAALSGIMRIFQKEYPLDKKLPPGVQRQNPWVGYMDSMALDAFHSFKISMRAVRNRLGRISVPYCSVMAANDQTVSAENQFYIYSRIQSREKRAFMLLLPPDLTNMHSLLTHHYASHKVFHFIRQFIDDTLDESGQAENGTPPLMERVKNIFRRNKPEDLIH